MQLPAASLAAALALATANRSRLATAIQHTRLTHSTFYIAEKGTKGNGAKE